MATVQINIDQRRAAQVRGTIGHVFATLVREFTDERGRNRMTVSINGVEFDINASTVVTRDTTVEWADPTWHVDFRQIKRMGGLNK